jgi:hypothetical protein
MCPPSGAILSLFERNSMLDLKSVRSGLVLALGSILFGYGLGIAFGAAEDGIQDALKASGEAVLATVYQGNAAELEKVLAKSWTYYKRAHLHAGALGASAVAQILLLSGLAVGARWKSVTAVMLGAGALGYGLYWMLAAQRAPGLGSTSAAKESLDWLAIPASGASILGTLLVLAFAVRALYRRRPPAGA